MRPNVDQIMSMPIVKKNGPKNMKSISSCPELDLMKTIYMPKNMSELKISLPKSKYHSPKTSNKTPKTSGKK